MNPQSFGVGDQIPSGVLLKARKGCRLAAAALVKQDDAVAVWIVALAQEW